MILEEGCFVCPECGYSISLAESENDDENSKSLPNIRSETSSPLSEQIIL